MSSNSASAADSASPKSYATIPTIDQEFTCFPKLPIELRLKVWENLLPDPQIIEFYQEDTPTGPGHAKVGSATQSGFLGLLRACRESRDVVLEKFEKVSAVNFNLLGMGAEDTLFVNYEKDTILFPMNRAGLIEMLTSSDLEKLKLIKKAAFPLYTTPPMNPPEPMKEFTNMLKALENLEDVSLLIQNADSSPPGTDLIRLQDATYLFDRGTITDAKRTRNIRHTWLGPWYGDFATEENLKIFYVNRRLLYTFF